MMIRLAQFNTPPTFSAVTSYSAIPKRKNIAKLAFFFTILVRSTAEGGAAWIDADSLRSPLPAITMNSGSIKGTSRNAFVQKTRYRHVGDFARTLRYGRGYEHLTRQYEPNMAQNFAESNRVLANH